jgi:hydrogenase maturation protease
METNILVLGLGNLLLRDEGLGVRALERLEARYELPPEVRCLDGGVLGLGLLAYLDGVTHLLILDAVQTGREPGVALRLEGAEIPANFSLKLSMHEIRFEEILAICRLRGALPPRLIVWGMEPAILAPGVELSEIVETHLDALVENAAGELRGWGVAVVAKTQ